MGSLSVGFLLVCSCILLSVSASPTGGRSQRVDKTADAADSPAMVNFKRSLSPSDLALVNKMKSKARYIQGVLESKQVMDKRDLVDVRSGDLQCCNCNQGSSGCYHPSDVKRSHVINCCAAPVKRQEADSKEEIDAALSKLSDADRKLVEKYPSKLHNVVVASEEPEGKDETSKKSKIAKKQETPAALDDGELEKLRAGLTDLEERLTALQASKAKPAESKDLEEISEKFISDVNLAKAKGIKLEDLLAALQKRAVRTNVRRSQIKP